MLLEPVGHVVTPTVVNASGLLDAEPLTSDADAQLASTGRTNATATARAATRADRRQRRRNWVPTDGRVTPTAVPYLDAVR